MRAAVFDHLRDAGVVSVAGGLRIFETPDVSDLLFVLSNNHFISFNGRRFLSNDHWIPFDEFNGNQLEIK